MTQIRILEFGICSLIRISSFEFPRCTHAQWHGRLALVLKFEARNSKFESNSNDPNSNFGIWNLQLDSKFEFRVSQMYSRSVAWASRACLEIRSTKFEIRIKFQ